MYLCQPMNLPATFCWPPIGVFFVFSSASFATLYCVQRAKLVIHVVCKKPNEFFCLQRGRLVSSFILCASFIWTQLFFGRSCFAVEPCKRCVYITIGWVFHMMCKQDFFCQLANWRGVQLVASFIKAVCMYARLFLRAVFLYTHFLYRAVFRIHTTVCRAVFMYTHFSYTRFQGCFHIHARLLYRALFIYTYVFYGAFLQKCPKTEMHVYTLVTFIGLFSCTHLSCRALLLLGLFCCFHIHISFVGLTLLFCRALLQKKPANRRAFQLVAWCIGLFSDTHISVVNSDLPNQNQTIELIFKLVARCIWGGYGQ